MRKDERTLQGWYTEMVASTPIQDLLISLGETYHKRYEELENLPQHVLDTIWYPFVQHKNVSRRQT